MNCDYKDGGFFSNVYNEILKLVEKNNVICICKVKFFGDDIIVKVWVFGEGKINFVFRFNVIKFFNIYL